MPLRVTFVGCGTLGSVYAAQLARAGAHVQALARGTETVRAIQLERRYPTPIVRLDSSVQLCRAIPKGTDLVVLAVRLEQIDEQLCAQLSTAEGAPLISLTPVFPSEHRRLVEALGREPIFSMPAVAAYLTGDVVRYFIAPMTATLVDTSGRQSDAVREFVSLLNGAGLPVRFRSRVMDRNLATTVAFFPVSLALFAAGGVEQLAARSELLDLASRATTEMRALARRLGPMDFGVAALTALISPTRIAWACRKGVTRNPAFLEFLDQHFARKLKDQHRILATEISTLAKEHGVEASAFQTLFDRFMAKATLQNQ